MSKIDLIRAMEAQKEIFGDELLTELKMPEKKDTRVYKNETQVNRNLAVNEKVQTKTGHLMQKQDFQKTTSLDVLFDKINKCQKCSLGATRTKFVFGVGNPKADLLLIGEAPGAEEDLQGIPFVGRAGKLLTDILKAINFEREEIYIANILKCRPPNNRDPQPVERETCSPYLMKQIELIDPKLILCLGRISANVLLGKNESLTRLRENVHDFHGIKLMATYHPAALLRNPHWKKGCWEDVQKVRKLYDELTGSK